MTDTFYRTFSEKKLTSLGGARRTRIERSRLEILARHATPPGPMLEIGPGQGTLAALAIQAGWQYSAIEPSPLLADRLRAEGLDVVQAWTPPMPAADCQLPGPLCGPGSRAHVGDRCRARVRRRGVARSSSGRRRVHRGARLPQGTRFFLGHRLHA